MEPVNTNANDLEHQDIYDDRLEQLAQEFKEFSEKIAESSLRGAMKYEDLIDLYIHNSGERACNKAQKTLDCETVFKDVDNFESTLISQQQTEHVQSIHEYDIDQLIQVSEKIIQEMMEDTSPNDTRNFPESSQTVNVNYDVGVVNSSTMVKEIRYGDLKCHEAADGIIGTVFGGSIETMLASVVEKNASRTTRRKGVKRKHRVITETEDETAAAHGDRQFMKGEQRTNLLPEITENNHLSASRNLNCGQYVSSSE